jgi:hypothetical protein
VNRVPLVSIIITNFNYGRFLGEANLILSSGTYLNSPTSGNAFARDVLTRTLPMPEHEWRISADGYQVNLVPFLGEFRLASLRMDRQEHSYPEDTRWFLVRPEYQQVLEKP